MIDRRPEWKQECPRDQLVVVLSAIEGHRLNQRDGIITADQFVEKTKDLFEQANVLVKMVGSGTWDLEK